MKKYLTIIWTLLTLTAFGQKEADSLFHKGGELFGQKDFLGAIYCFKEIELNYSSFGDKIRYLLLGLHYTNV